MILAKNRDQNVTNLSQDKFGFGGGRTRQFPSGTGARRLSSADQFFTKSGRTVASVPSTSIDTKNRPRAGCISKQISLLDKENNLRRDQQGIRAPYDYRSLQSFLLIVNTQHLGYSRLGTSPVLNEPIVLQRESLAQESLSKAERHDRLFIVFALAYIFLCACGAFAEHTGLAQALKANPRKDRVTTLLRTGRQLLDRQHCKPKRTFQAWQAVHT